MIVINAIWVQNLTVEARHQTCSAARAPRSATTGAGYRLVDAAYERRALAVSSDLHPSGFDEIMPKTLARATVDRLLHHAHIVVTQGDGFRLAQAASGKGVKPLT